MAKDKGTSQVRVSKNGMSVEKQKHPVQPKREKKNTFVYQSGQKVTTSPEGVKTFAEAMEKVKRNYSGAWERLAKK